uniref:Serine-tRNA synthetase type1 N-terminal domain-containing protein n=1 Tax=Oryza meridionalis TaxID=40149 RepID=A0A0E0D5W2_9ORYZ
MLDINLFRTGRCGKKEGGNPDAVRESQRSRFASVDIVDEVIYLVELWRSCKFSSSLALQDLRRTSI